jgi:hypothetical protein
VKKNHQEPSTVKVMLTVADDVNGVILHHVVPASHAVTAEYYQAFLEHQLHLAL